jgi:peroxiredoxin
MAFSKWRFMGLSLIVLAVIGSVTLTASAREINAGETSPGFEGKATNGEMFRLADQKGKYVVLEWTNHECPFVRKHYESGNMQKLQQFANNNDMVWVSIISSAPGKQGNVTPEEANKIAEQNYATPDYIILDQDGHIGRMFDAKTTPHMILLGVDSEVMYNGAVDSINSIDQEDVDRAEKYFYNAMIAAKKGETIDIAQSKPYGCSIKY